MQAIKNSRKPRRKLFWAILIVLILLGGGIAFAYLQKIGPFSASNTENVNYDPPTNEQKQAGEAIKKQSLDSASDEDNTKPSAAGSQSENNSPSAKTVAVEITNTPLAKTNGKLTVNTLIQKSNASGTCTLTVSKSGQTAIAKTAKAQISGSVATCAGFRNIDVSKLAAGKWSVTVSYSDASSNGSTSEDVTL